MKTINHFYHVYLFFSSPHSGSWKRLFPDGGANSSISVHLHTLSNILRSHRVATTTETVMYIKIFCKSFS